MALTSINKAYTSYKSSDIEWIGEIPDGWSVRKLKWCLLPGRKGMRIGPFGSSLKLDIMVDDGIKVYGQENVISSDYSSDTGKRRISYEKFKEMEAYEVFPDDILLSMMGSTGNFSRVPANVEKGIIDSHLLRIRFNELLNLDYFIYLSNYSAAVSQQVEAVGKGSIMQGLNSSLVRQLWLPLPPLPEQQAIASFLDRETARINKIIEKQTRLVELLKEKRSALITQAVTRGLDPNAKKKDSGVEWIGEIPEGWGVYKIKFMIEKSLGGGTPNTSIPSYWDGDIPWVSPKDMKVDIIRDSEECITEKGVAESTVNMIPADALLCVFRSGILKHTFPIAINEIPVTLNQDMKALIPESKTSSAYLYWLFSGFNKTILNLCVKVIATVDSIESKYFYNLVLPLPSVHEQKIIMDYLTKETSLINNLMLKIEKQINLLYEYKQSLITAAVTGKIDVRDVQ